MLHRDDREPDRTANRVRYAVSQSYIDEAVNHRDLRKAAVEWVKGLPSDRENQLGRTSQPSGRRLDRPQESPKIALRHEVRGSRG